MMEKARNHLQVLLSRELYPIVFGYLRAGIGAGKQGYHRDHPIEALPSGNIALSCFMSLSGDSVAWWEMPLPGCLAVSGVSPSPRLSGL